MIDRSIITVRCINFLTYLLTYLLTYECDNVLKSIRYGLRLGFGLHGWTQLNRWYDNRGFSKCKLG